MVPSCILIDAFDVQEMLFKFVDGANEKNCSPPRNPCVLLFFWLKAMASCPRMTLLLLTIILGSFPGTSASSTPVVSYAFNTSNINSLQERRATTGIPSRCTRTHNALFLGTIFIVWGTIFIVYRFFACPILYSGDFIIYRIIYYSQYALMYHCLRP